MMLQKIVHRDAQDKGQFLASLDAEAGAALPVSKRSPGGGLGFFEQGIVTGLLLFVSPVVVVLAYVGVPKAAAVLTKLCYHSS